MPPKPDPTAKKQLIGYQRVSLAPGASATLTFNITAPMLSTVTRRGARHVLAGRHDLIFSRGHGAELRAAVDVRVADAGGQRVVVSDLEEWARA